jgi:hypothetical protein
MSCGVRANGFGKRRIDERRKSVLPASMYAAFAFKVRSN